MTDERLTETVSDYVAAWVKEARKRRHWRPADLAEHCAGLTENSIENIEGGRRQAGRRTRFITVDELFELAAALECQPEQLLPHDPDRTTFTFDSKSYDEIIAGLEAAKQFVDLQRWREETGN